jgi:hypothetical protein
LVSHFVVQVLQPSGAADVARTSAWLIVKVKPAAGPLPVAARVKAVAVGVPEQVTTKLLKVRGAASVLAQGVVKVPAVA